MDQILTRDVVMFALGMATFVHETFFGQVDRPYIIMGSLALMGFPLVLRGTAKVANGVKNGINNHKGGGEK